MSGYIGVNNKSKHISKIYVGDSTGHAKLVNKAYIGINNESKLWYETESPNYLQFSSSNSFKIYMARATWNGTLEYNKDMIVTENSEWKTVYPGLMPYDLTSNIGSDGLYYLNLRGINNNHFLKTSSSTTSVFRVHSSNNYDEVRCIGKLNSLLDYTNSDNIIMDEYGFSQLFKDSTILTSCPDIILSSNNNISRCFASMYENCTNLKNPPKFIIQGNITTIPESYFKNMFYGCTNLQTFPNLYFSNITTYNEYSFNSMFANCSKLFISLTPEPSGSKEWKIKKTSSYIPTNAFENMVKGTIPGRIENISPGTTYYVR